MTRERLRRIGGTFLILAIVLFGGLLLVSGLTGTDYGPHSEGHPWGCLVSIACAAFLGISILCWFVSLFLPRGFR